MKLTNLFILKLLIIVILFSTCQTNKTDSSNLSQLSVDWQLVGNMANGDCVAEFTFFNNSSEPITSSRWALYFNQNTLNMGNNTPDSALGVVEHINGDLYRFIPGALFTIPASDSLKIQYRYKGVMIKEKDAPNGAYFAEVSDNNQEFIVLPQQFTVRPFTNLNTIFPDTSLLKYIPNPTNIYTQNLSISTLPLPQVGKIIPTPIQMLTGAGTLTIHDKTTICYTSNLENEAQYLANALKKLFNISLTTKVTNNPIKDAQTIQLHVAPTKVTGISAEAYHLEVSPNQGITITGNDGAGVFYGIQSLVSLIWADKSNAYLGVQAVDIKDAPRFSYRGFLLDVARNFQKKEAVLKLIDVLALYKINILNIRITEDEGWRIEIKGLPELTEVGSKRGHTKNSKNWLTPSFGSGPDPNSKNNHGTGYYTRQDFIDILKYANQRHIQVIPEVCFPSHARAAIKAMEARYDYYMAKKDTQKAQEFRLIDPNDKSEYLSAQMYKDNIVCVAQPSVYHFYDYVVNDFISMYQEAGLKMTMFNTGGDEVPKGAWTQSPLCSALMKTLPNIQDARQLQGYFLEKSMAILEKYNLQVSGWEEIVLNKNSQGDVVVNPKFVGKQVFVLVWDNTDNNIDLGYRIANSGYPVVLCNVTNLYFDLAYNADPTEPGLYWGGFQDAIDPYVLCPYNVFKTANFNMFSQLTETQESFSNKQGLKPDCKKNIIGVQAQLWSETVKGASMMEYYVIPKLFAFAEKAWAKAPLWEEEANLKKRNADILKGWNELSNRIGQKAFPFLDAYFGEFNYRIPPVGAIIDQGILKSNIAFPGLIVRYTTDGSEPTNTSPEYTAPVRVKGSVNIRAFNKKGRGGNAWTVVSK
ncbi:MAG: family 20 glycosylhydrolase [Alphaproteobacteria bacterium]|nr:family 20 glycosylhydrolase [Alphaproteobacteria bacterium]